MKKNQKYRKQRKGNQFMPVVIGVTLILTGLVLFGVLKGADEASASTPVDRSVVPMKVNYSAPPLSLENVNSKTEALEDFRGQVVLVNNWATWCPPCKAEMPTLEKYYETYREQGFNIVAIEAGEGRAEVAAFAKEYGLQFHIWLDPNGAALKAFKNGNLPNSYVIDRSGTVRYAWTGEISLAMLEEFITPLLKGNT
jgi:peroxiredoxin